MITIHELRHTNFPDRLNWYCCRQYWNTDRDDLEETPATREELNKVAEKIITDQKHRPVNDHTENFKYFVSALPEEWLATLTNDDLYEELCIDYEDYHFMGIWSWYCTPESPGTDHQLCVQQLRYTVFVSKPFYIDPELHEMLGSLLE